jgi:hypothetical protein
MRCRPGGSIQFRCDSFAQSDRILRVLDGCRPANETAFDDPVGHTLWGGSDLDWFFLDVARDQVNDKASAESIADRSPPRHSNVSKWRPGSWSDTVW